MSRSYNGWQASPDRSAINIEPLDHRGEDFPGGVRHSHYVAYIFGDLVRWLDRHVERMHKGWCWGFYYRQTTGGTSLSNHASGTAIDYNAPAHPYGVRGTWSRRQKRRINRRLRRRYKGVIRWGENYSGNVDGMHFEVNASPERVAAVGKALARKRRDGGGDSSSGEDGGTKPLPWSKHPQAHNGIVHLSKVGMGEKGPDVVEVQRVLNAWYRAGLKQDGIWGPKTQAVYDTARRRMGFEGDDARGEPGRESLSRLGFKVRR